MNQKRKKQIAILLVCCMLFTLLPTTALASEPMPIASGSGRTQTVTNSQLLFAAMADTSVTTIMLDADITIDATLYVGAIDDARTVTLDLNGHVLKAVSADNCIYIFPESYLILQDSAPNNTHSDMTLPAGGVITNSSDRGVFNVGNFTMNGGAIANCEVGGYGGGVYNYNTGIFYMNGGTIDGCKASQLGGGVYNLGTFAMAGNAEISDCEADYGGGVMNFGTFTMAGNSKIADCTADHGGAVYNDNSFTMTGNAKIGDCTAKTEGSGIYLYVGSNGTATLYANGGEVYNDVTCDNYGGTITITNNANATSATVFYGDLTKNDGAIIDGHMVTFLKGENDVYAWEVVPDGGKAVEPETDPIRDGYLFQYWCDSNGNKVDFDTFTITEDTTLKAKWRKEIKVEDLTIQIDSLTYNGRVQSPTVTIWYGDQKLEKDKDYILVKDSDIAATEVGTYELMIRINGEDIVGQITVPWSIEAATYSGGGGYYAPEEETDKANKTEETTWSNPFTDVHESDWFYNAVKYAHQHKLFAGMSTTEFAPNMPMSRGMLVTVLYRMAGSPAVDGNMPFVDVNSGAYYRNAILWAVQNNIVSGIADNLFAPDTDITREQLAVILYRFAQYCGYDTTQGGMQIREYSDYENISGYALNAMTWAVNSGLLKGKGENNIAPQDTATRAEVAAILQRFIASNQ